ncbi:PepSY-associated TM helix domain-containing protein [Sphingobacterium siyangense]|uniref:Putative iron-regulated membrane protein n=1 Tax=Sphingobacterium siyangense TaxID=459529 RepID=A0A562MGU5_9SPHI|nr:PepSY-associated TM helix domain-containing protein [Sphingobacterium siyangense]TWI19143.1 putative iron-regulated membrane protein [Sphingobacterium siyangense]
MSNFKKSILFLHRWLGFISGLAVFVVSITGCIFCFQDEIQDVLYSYRTVKAEQKPFIKPSELQSLTIAKYPKAKITLVMFYGPERSAQVRISQNKVTKSVYYNPYSGAYLHTEVMKENFFLFIKEVHLNLFLPPKIGKLVNGICVIIFVVIMISGLILWWPKRKTDRKRSLTIKWGGRWRRVNYDLHNVLGFYITSFAIILAISGLSFSFQWVKNGIANVANNGKEYPKDKEVFKSDSIQKINFPDSAFVIDKAFDIARLKSPNSNSFLIFPGSKQSSPISITTYPKPLHFSYSSNFSFDRYSGKLLNFIPYSSKSPGTKLNTLNYDIHTGQIAGFLGKLIAFLVSLISASLPITGLILYLGKKYKSKKSSEKSKKILSKGSLKKYLKFL